MGDSHSHWNPIEFEKWALLAVRVKIYIGKISSETCWCFYFPFHFISFYFFFLSSEPLGYNNNITAESQLYRAAAAVNTLTYVPHRALPCCPFPDVSPRCCEKCSTVRQNDVTGTGDQNRRTPARFFPDDKCVVTVPIPTLLQPPPTPVNQLWTNSRSLLRCQDESNQICGTAATRIWLFRHICDA